MTRPVEECKEPSLGPERCANEGCTRRVERGERWCPTCGLERALFRREARRPVPAGSSRPPALDSLGPFGDASSPRVPEPPSRAEAGRR